MAVFMAAERVEAKDRIAVEAKVKARAAAIATKPIEICMSHWIETKIMYNSFSKPNQ